MIRITVNNQQTEIAPNATLIDLLSQLGIQSRKGVAIAINEEIINSSDFTRTPLRDDDQVQIFKAIQGG